MSEKPRDPVEWREWARNKLQALVDGLGDERARVQAAKALLDSLDHQLEPKTHQNGTNAQQSALPSGGAVTPYAELPSKEAKRLALDQAKQKLAELEAELDSEESG